MDYIPVSEIEVVLKDRFGKKDINELLVQEEQLLKKKMSLISNPKLKTTIAKLFNDIEIVRSTENFHTKKGQESIKLKHTIIGSANNYKGIFAMATGRKDNHSSQLRIIRIKKANPDKTYHILILVPTITLVEQWEREMKSFNFQEVYKI